MMENKVDSPRTPLATPKGSGSPLIRQIRRSTEIGSPADSPRRTESPLIKEIRRNVDVGSPLALESTKDDVAQDDEQNEIVDDKVEEEKQDVVEDGDKDGDEGGGLEGGDSPEEDVPVVEVVAYTMEQAFEDIDQFLSAEHAEDSPVSAAVPDFVEKFLDLLEEKIGKYSSESADGKVKWGTNSEDDKSFLHSIRHLSRLAESINLSKLGEESGPSINRIESVRQLAMSFLEDEFRLLLNECKHQEMDTGNDEEKPPSQSEDQAVTEVDPKGFPLNIVSSLNHIAEEMISGGFKTEYHQVYAIGRKNYFDELLAKMGFEILSIDEVQKMPWEVVEREIVKWVAVYRECTKVHFSLELNLVESVFSGDKPAAHRLFDNLSHCVIIHMVNFAEAVAMIPKQSVEKMFKFLDVYETLRDTEPAIDKLFANFEEMRDIKTEIVIARSRIGEAVLSMFHDLENSIKSDTSKNIMPGGAVHPISRYTMNYMELACEYKDTLEHIFKEHLKIERADSNPRPDYPGEGSSGLPPRNNAGALQHQSPFSAQLMRVMELLESNLEARSKLYRDIPLSSIFMMNNGRYILQKVRGSKGINESVGDVWSRKKSADLRQYHQNYKRETWGKVLGCLTEKGLTVNGKVVKPELKERFKSFNAQFDEIHRTQSTWVVNDEQMQSELRVSISAVVVPAYRSFLGRFSQVFTAGRQTEKYVKYQPEDLENHIDELFDGNANAGKKKS